MEAPRNPHDDKMDMCWNLCRFGLGRVRGDGAARDLVLAWIERMRPLFPGSPWFESWARIVSGAEPELARELGETPSFFDLDQGRRSFWRPLAQSNPFACLLRGKSARERRAVLSRVP